MLYGRAAEAAEIDRLLRDARSGRSAVLTIAGEAGIGKTALLEHAASSAEGFQILRCTGVESEAELPFAGLHLLLRPFLDRLDALPAPQAAALRGAFGLAETTAADRFLVGLATLTLLSEVAADCPVLCLIDDPQWLDRESSEALLFAGRRLYAEGIVIIGATRDPTPPYLGLQQPRGQLRLAGLDRAAAEALLDDQAGDLPPDVRERLIGETAGNPLALIELSAAMQARLQQQPVGPITVDTSLGESRVQDAFWRQAQRLPAATKTAVLVAAADDTGEAGVVLAAAGRLGVGLADLKPAEEAGLVQLSGATLNFRHPLVRSAVYARAAASDRVAAHRALADEFGREEHADRRAWQLAAAATGADDAVAAELESAADRARLRGGYAASSAAYERAAGLTAETTARGRRLAAAASDAHDVGQLARATALASEAARLTSDPAIAANLATVRARVEFEQGTPRRACDLLMHAARPITGTEPEQAGWMLVEAIRMGYFADQVPGIGDASEMIDALRLPAEHPLRPLLRGSAIIGRLLSGTPPEQLPPLHLAVGSLRPEQLPGQVALQIVSLWYFVGRIGQAYENVNAMVSQARERGRIGVLPFMLQTSAEYALPLGRLREASSAATEGTRIAEDTEQQVTAANLRSVTARVAAMTGDEQRCVALAEELIRYGTVHRTGANVLRARLALCTLDLGLARYQSAFGRLENLDPGLSRHLVLALNAPPDWIEAAVRSGRPERAAEILAGYEMWISRHQDGPARRAIARRCRALLSDGDQADEHFRTALHLHRRSESVVAQARTQLLYGEWLRRDRRRTEARDQLRSALRAFEDAGAGSWAERTRSELRAAGESITLAADRTKLIAGLTPQELQIARLAATGLTNRDIGAQLFLSPRTVGYHLYKVFPKLGISARADLARMDLA